MMVGREIFIERSGREVPANAGVALEVKNINAGRMVQNISFSVSGNAAKYSVRNGSITLTGVSNGSVTIKATVTYNGSTSTKSITVTVTGIEDPTPDHGGGA